MTGMFQCTGGGWCGWGYPQAAGTMIGTSALIVKPCATCSSGARSASISSSAFYNLMRAIKSTHAGGWCGQSYPQAAGTMHGTSALIVKPCAKCSSGVQSASFLSSGFWSLMHAFKMFLLGADGVGDSHRLQGRMHGTFCPSLLKPCATCRSGAHSALFSELWFLGFDESQQQESCWGLERLGDCRRLQGQSMTYLPALGSHAACAAAVLSLLFCALPGFVDI